MCLKVSKKSPAHGQLPRQVIVPIKVKFPAKYCTYKLLNLDFLELQKLARTRLLVKLSLCLVGFAGLRVALRHGHELTGCDLLEVFISARFASIGSNLHEWLHGRNTSHDSLQSHQFAQGLGLDFTNGKSLLTRRGSEDDLAIVANVVVLGSLILFL